MNKAYIRRIKKANDIAAVIGEVVELEEQSGKENLTGWCPFGEHGTHPGNFQVNRRKQIYKCFMCGAGGNVITFTKEFYKLPYRTAVAQLAERAGIAPPKKQVSYSASEINPRDLWHGVFVPHWLLCREEVSQGAKLCYGRLCKYYNPNTGQCNPKHDTLGTELGVDERMVRRYVNELIEHRLIKKHRQFGPGKPNNYGFLKHKWFADALKRPKKITQSKNDELPF